MMRSPLFVILIFALSITAQDTEAHLLGGNDFQLSSSAAAAGINGKILILLTVKANGTVTDLKMFDGPMWPCGSKEPDELQNVRRAVKQYVLSMKFEPATKNGKPKSSDIKLMFPVTDLFRNANNIAKTEENLKKGIDPALVEVDDVLKYAVFAPKQVIPALIGNVPSLWHSWAEIQILVDENGEVVSAGSISGGSVIQLAEARKLACAAKFKPLTLNSKPVKMSGTILYDFY